MAIQNETSLVSHEGNNSAVTSYAVSFYFLREEDLRVVVTDEAGAQTTLDLEVDYTVTGAGVEYGGAIVTREAVPASGTVTIYRLMEATQTARYIENDKFPAAAHELALDKLTMLAQQALRAVGRCLRVGEADGVVTEAAKKPLSLLGMSGEGNPVFRTADEVVSFLNLTSQVYDRPMKTFGDAGERAAAVPEYHGQLGTQRDTGGIYISSGIGAGAWSVFNPTAFISTIQPGESVTELSVSTLSTHTVQFSAKQIVLYNDAGKTVRFPYSGGVGAGATVDIAVAGVNGLQAGLSKQPNTWYYLYAISDGTNLRGYFSDQGTGVPGWVTAPYDAWEYYRFLGAVRTDGSGNFLPFEQQGNRVFCEEKVLLAGAAGTTSLTSLDVSALVPARAKILHGVCGRSTAGNALFVFDRYASGAYPTRVAVANSTLASNAIYSPTPFSCLLSIAGAPALYWKTDSTASVYSVSVNGWEFGF